MSLSSILYTPKLYSAWSSVRTAVFYKSNGYLKHKSLTKCFSSTYFPTEKITNLKQDTLLFSLEKTKFIRYLTIYGFFQCGMCIFLGYNTFISLKDTGSKRDVSLQPSDTSWRDINLGAVKHRILSSLTCFCLGFLTAFICYTLPTRIVKTITLCKGGNVASFVTYGPFGKTRQFTVPLQQMSCIMTRDQAKSYIPIKIKNRWFYFLIDSKGEFHKPSIFDVTVGARNYKLY